MKVSLTFPLVAYAFALALSASAADLKESKFTQVINDVKVVTMPDKAVKPVAVNDVFKMPEIVRTGAASRAELVAEDKTITRVGANTIFSFDAANRTIDLEKGSLLFHSPKGKGGGKIKTGSATAAVLGTTIIVSSTPDGGFKLLVLEGTAKVTLANGTTQIVKAGQEVFILPGGDLSPIIDFRLANLVENSRLVNGFENPLPSLDNINHAVSEQEKLVVNGKAIDTGLLIGEVATVSTVEAVDPAAFPQVLTPPGAGNGTPGGLLTPSVLNVDAVINSPRLDVSHLFLKPTQVSGAGLSGTFVGFFARDIGFVSGSETIDLFPYETLGTFTFLASRNINVQNSIEFFGSSSLDLSLVAKGSINIGADTTLKYDGHGFFIQAGNSMSYDSVAFENNIGLLDIQTGGSMSLQNCSVFGADMNLTASQNLTFNNTTVSASGGILSAQVVAPITPTGTINLSAVNGSILANNSTFSGNILNGQASALISLDSINVASLNSINLQAHTISLKNINFRDGSIVNLKSDLGQLAPNPNTGQAPVAGYVNFISNVNYGGKPAQDYVNPQSGSGIYISKLQ